jgi:pimeloyl-ACP methyl ester carboxylesterase
MKRLPVLAALLAATTLSACVRRYSPDPRQVDCDAASRAALLKEREAERRAHPDPLVHQPGTILKVIRLTDYGEVHNRCEWSDALEQLKRDSTNGAGTITVMFVHGWKHNGDVGDDNLQHFAKLVDTLRAHEVATGRDRRVVGLYLAWSGKRLRDIFLLRELTFWSRKKAADGIAQSGTVTKLLGAVDHMRMLRDNGNDRVVYVGHSFGARLLFNAIAQVALHSSQMAHPGSAGAYAPFDAAGDLVLLVNPAFEAQLFTALDGLNQRRYAFSGEQRPLIVSIAADNDRATQMAFPIGQMVGLTFGGKRRKTLGNFADYQTHRLRLATGASAAPAGTAWFDHYCAEGPGAATACLERLASPTDSTSRRFKVAGNPFIVARAESRLVDGHSEIWGDQFVSFLASFIARATVKPRDRPTSWGEGR